MALTYQSFADSKPFKFLVGETHKPFYIHGSLVTQQSPALANLVRGGMLEAMMEYAILDDMDEETFMRFTQFAYTGDYAVADPVVSLADNDIGIENGVKNGERNPGAEVVEDYPEYTEADAPPEAPPEAEPAAPDDFWGGFGSTTRTRKSKRNKSGPWTDSRVDEPQAAPSSEFRSKRERLWDAFTRNAAVKQVDVWRPSVNSDPCEDYTPVFLCHAKLYTFSDKYSIEPLLELVLQKLRLNLSQFKLHSQRIGDIVELMKYTYEHTIDYEEGIDRLRNLVADYVVCHVEKIVGFGEFTKLLQENGEVAKDLMPKLMQRLD